MTLIMRITLHKSHFALPGYTSMFKGHDLYHILWNIRNIFSLIWFIKINHKITVKEASDPIKVIVCDQLLSLYQLLPEKPSQPCLSSCDVICRTSKCVSLDNNLFHMFIAQTVMVRQCVAQFCSNSNQSGHSIHRVPKDNHLRRQWVRFFPDQKSWFQGTQ